MTVVFNGVKLFYIYINRPRLYGVINLIVTGPCLFLPLCIQDFRITDMSSVAKAKFINILVEHVGVYVQTSKMKVLHCLGPMRLTEDKQHVWQAERTFVLKYGKRPIK